jgi:hypothetical protein
VAGPVTEPSVQFTTDPSPPTSGEPITLTATVNPAPASGAVTFTVDGRPLPCGSDPHAELDTAGHASCQTMFTVPAEVQVVARFSGSGRFLPSSTERTVRVADGFQPTRVQVSTAVPHPDVSQPYALVVKVVAENQDGSMSPAYGGTAVIYDAAGNQVGSRVGLQPDGTALLPDLVSPDTGPVEARYTGGAGLQPSVSTRFTATADNPDIIPPLVKLTGPYTGSVVKGDLVIKAQVSDNDQVSQVDAVVVSSPGGTLDGQTLSELTPVAEGYQARFDSRTMPDGSYQLVVVATDPADNSSTSQIVTFAVDNHVPQVTLEVPGTPVAGPVPMLVRASDGNVAPQVTLTQMRAPLSSDPAVVNALGPVPIDVTSGAQLVS